METAKKAGKKTEVFVLIESNKDPKKDKRVEVYTTFKGLNENESFNGPGGEPGLSRYKLNKQLKEKGKFTHSDYDRHIEIRKTALNRNTK